MNENHAEYFARLARLDAARQFVLSRIGRRSKFKPRLRNKYLKNK
jgi:hypothetical protein